MTREEVSSIASSLFLSNKTIALELGTGFGKSKMAIDLINLTPKSNAKILLLIAKRVHKQNWLDEIHKWGGLKDNPQLVIECYNSLHKHEGESFDFIICDECHHLSDKRKDSLLLVKADKYIFLSATINQGLRLWLSYSFHCQFVTSSLQESIEDGVLPTPQIILIPLTLDNVHKTEKIELYPKLKGPVLHDNYENLWKYKKNKHHVILSATPQQYLQYLNTEILYLKNCYMRTYNEGVKFKWLKLCDDRLKFLAYCKNNIVYNLLKRLKNKRTLTFCKSIEQTEVLGKNCIHSKNKYSDLLLDEFNKEKINHITTCQILNEGVNIKNCQYGIFANLNASKTITIQRQGRLLRHPHPVIIIPYYKLTREEEIMEKMLEGYDESLIKTMPQETINSL